MDTMGARVFEGAVLSADSGVLLVNKENSSVNVYRIL
jgi:hypothetical protein